MYTHFMIQIVGSGAICYFHGMVVEMRKWKFQDGKILLSTTKKVERLVFFLPLDMIFAKVIGV